MPDDHGGGHAHVLDERGDGLLCACRACALLFERDAAGGGGAGGGRDRARPGPPRPRRRGGGGGGGGPGGRGGLFSPPDAAAATGAPSANVNANTVTSCPLAATDTSRSRAMSGSTPAMTMSSVPNEKARRNRANNHSGNDRDDSSATAASRVFCACMPGR
ncbi:DUF5947 family protein [Actinomadura sp. WAC 06369]|uniref:DUF5947 family protein n=1 Tax=Actinomadura sp. WAC 06369 TaxID=2203193 RepID=UPI003FA39F64